MTLLRESLDLLDCCHKIEATLGWYSGEKLSARLALAAQCRAESRALAAIHHSQEQAMKRAA